MARTDDIRLDDFVELSRFLERFPDIADEPRMRWWIYNRRANGIEEAGAVVKRTGRWYVVVPRLRDWMLRS
jgi:hypothetical protein